MTNVSLTSCCTIMVLIVAILLSPILVSRAETNLVYRVSIGDKRTYRVIERYRVDNEGKKEEVETLTTFDAGEKTVNFTLKKGTAFTFTITDINNSGVYGIETINNEFHSSKLNFSKSRAYEMFFPFYKNKIIIKITDNDSYFQGLVNKYNMYSLEGEFFVEKSEADMNGEKQLFKWNIKTGWLESFSSQHPYYHPLGYKTQYTVQRISSSPSIFLYLLLSIAALGTGMLLAYFYERIKFLK